jgi:hypothetical protein
MSADGPGRAVTVSPVTELIVRELRLRRFDGLAPTAPPRSVPVGAGVNDASNRPPDDHGLKRLAARHSCRRGQPADLGL